jgi:hypothetical protein
MEIPIVKDKLKINDVPEDDSKKMIQKMMGHLVNKLLPELKPRDWEIMVIIRNKIYENNKILHLRRKKNIFYFCALIINSMINMKISKVSKII